MPVGIWTGILVADESLAAQSGASVRVPMLTAVPTTTTSDWDSLLRIAN